MPTLTEMLVLLRNISTEDNVEITTAIVGILRSQEAWKLTKVEIIRAFVDKAAKHVEPLEGQPNYYGQFYIAIKEFLDEMETVNVEGT